MPPIRFPIHWLPTRPPRINRPQVIPTIVGDMNEVLGQEHAKWALQVAAAGGHNLIMTGPPGSGKTMLASRMPGIMCPLNEAEQLEVASIRSLCGILPQYGITDMPPFEAPHHTSTAAGGGSGIAVPGAITRAHRGILFLDEAPEFSARALQTLREPLESGMWRFPVQKAAPTTRPHSNSSWRPTPVRADTITAPANVALAGKSDRIRYFSRLSGPILDRVDIQMAVPPVSRIAAQSEPIGESSAGIQARVIRARQVAKDRFRQYGWVCNAQASGKWLHRQYIAESDGIGQSGPVQSSTHIAQRADRAMRLSLDARRSGRPRIPH